MTQVATSLRTDIASLLARATSGRGSVLAILCPAGDGPRHLGGRGNRPDRWTPGAGAEELLRCPKGLLALAIDLGADDIGAVLLGSGSHLRAGDEVERTGSVASVPVGDHLLGRVIDPLGRPLDEAGPLGSSPGLPIERPAPAIMDRFPVNVPLHTGIKVVDALVPIGRGQRELIIGDRQTGKTSVAVDTIINQRDENVLCVYCAIGQRASSVARVIAELRAGGAMSHTVVVVTEGDDAPGLTYIAPYAATRIAEHFMEQGRDVLIVYDDLTNHARAYREISLLLRRPPGREAFPGDVFYLHSRLLERATRLAPEKGGGSLTALPIVETQAQNLAAYIPTNLISITDGQLYLSPTLFGLGILPAVDVGRSVSRVGGKAQAPALRAAAGSLKLDYAQFKELEEFTRLGARLDERTQRLMTRGRRIRECLKQAEHEQVPLGEQITVLLALGAGLFDAIPLERMKEAEQLVREATAEVRGSIGKDPASVARLTPTDREAVLDVARRALAGLPASA